jgi:energy-coupling factor transporter ATP-binding protein EcfA2
VVSVIRARSGPRGRFSRRSHRLAWPGVGQMLAPAELVGIIGWPLDGPAVPSLRYNRSPQLLPDDDIPARGKGRTFGVSTWPGLEERRLIQPSVGAQSHTMLLGPTGSGKSALLTHLLVADLHAGHGALLLDMKGDTATDLLERIPPKRLKDVVVLDPSISGPLPGLKALHADNPELVADLWVGVFRNLFADSWGVRSERYIRLGVQTLACLPGAVITDLPRVFHDLAFRRRLLSASGDQMLATAWASFDALSPGQQAEHLAAPLSKVQDVVGRRVVRDVLGQADPKLNLAQALQQRKIVVVRLAPGLIGQATAQLLGALVIWEVYQAVLGRQRLPIATRRPFGIYVDEPAVLNALPVPLDSLFELARGLGVGVTLAAQSLSQLPQAVRRAALTNAATIACFQAGADDASLVARELLGVTADELQHLGQYEIALRMGLSHGLRAPVTTATTLPPLERTSDPTQLRRASAQRYGGQAAPPPQSSHSGPSGSSIQPDPTTGTDGNQAGPGAPATPGDTGDTGKPPTTPLGRVRRPQ